MNMAGQPLIIPDSHPIKLYTPLAKYTAIPYHTTQIKVSRLSGTPDHKSAFNKKKFNFLHLHFFLSP